MSSLSLGKRMFNLEGGSNRQNANQNPDQNHLGIELIGSPLRVLNGIYIPIHSENNNNNSRIQFEKYDDFNNSSNNPMNTNSTTFSVYSNSNSTSTSNSPDEKVQLIWNDTTHQWNLIHIIKYNNNYTTHNTNSPSPSSSSSSSSTLLGYCSVNSMTLQDTSSLWYIKTKTKSNDDEFMLCPNMRITAISPSNIYPSDNPLGDRYHKYNIPNNNIIKPFQSFDISSSSISSSNGMGSSNNSSNNNSIKENNGSNSELFGLPRQLVPLYCSFICDAISVGLVMPLLPFFAIELGANAFQLSLVASSNYFAQMIGTIIMGQVSDTFGRKIVLLLCLIASSVQYLCVSYSQNLVQLTLGRIISGMFGGLVPVMQSCVADTVREIDRPKYLGRVTASFGLGFVLGPLLSAAVSSSVLDLTIRQKIRLATIFPLIGWLISFFFLKETNKRVIVVTNKLTTITTNMITAAIPSTNNNNNNNNNNKLSSSSSSSSSSGGGGGSGGVVRPTTNRHFAQWSGKLFTSSSSSWLSWFASNKDKDKASLSPSPSTDDLLTLPYSSYNSNSNSSSNNTNNNTNNSNSKIEDNIDMTSSSSKYYGSNLFNQSINTINNCYTSLHNKSSSSSSCIPTTSTTTTITTTRLTTKNHLNLKPEVLLLVLNGFLLMYAFATETIYAMFIKDSFGLGEKALSLLFALNGVMIGLFQVFLIKPLVSYLGKHATLAIGNAVLALGMIGVALIRNKLMHFSIFAVHVVGYSIADTALVSLVTHYSPVESQGRALALNHAAQACARVISPLVAGLVYEYSKDFRAGDAVGLPVGALPFLLGAVFPALGIAVPSMLYIWSISRKQQQQQLLQPQQQQGGTQDFKKNNKNKVSSNFVPDYNGHSSSSSSTSAAAATDDDNERLLQTTPSSSSSMLSNNNNSSISSFLSPLKKTAEDNA